MVDRPITGAMAAWRRLALTYAPWLLCIAFAYVIFRLWHIVQRFPVPPSALLPLSILIMATMIIAVAVQVWYRQRTIAEIEYDGHKLRFQTVGRFEAEVRPIEEVSDIGEWREWRGSRAWQLPVVGYQITFRDRAKVFLPFSVSNSRELSARLQADRWPKSPSEP